MIAIACKSIELVLSGAGPPNKCIATTPTIARRHIGFRVEFVGLNVHRADLGG